jgi:hypothetical protein
MACCANVNTEVLKSTIRTNKQRRRKVLGFIREFLDLFG